MLTYLLHLSPAQKQTIAQQLKTKYPYEEIYAQHDAVIKERDDAVQRVKSRKGTKYILDLVKIREWFQLKAREKEIFLKGIEKIYPHGVETFQLGDIRLTTPDTPLSQTWLHTYEWIAAEPEKGDKEYQVTFEKKDGDTYKNLVFRTGGFTLNAPEAQIKEDKDKNEIRIVVLSPGSR